MVFTFYTAVTASRPDMLFVNDSDLICDQ